MGLVLDIIKCIILSFYPLVFIFGLIGNFTTFLLFSRKKFKLLKTTIYFKFLNITETITLSFSMVDYLNYQYGINLSNASYLFCKFTYYVLYIFSPVSGWILVILSFDRLLSTKYPSKLLIRNKKQIKLIICGFVIFCNIVYNLPIAILSKYETVYQNDSSNNNSDIIFITNECISGDQYGISDWLDLLNSSIIPFIFMSIFTAKALKTLFESRRKTHNVSCSTTQRNESFKRRDLRYAFTLLTFNFSFLILNLPVVSFFVILRYVDINQNLSEFLLIFTTLLFYSYYGSFFYLNLLINAVFRNELKALIKTILRKK